MSLSLFPPSPSSDSKINEHIPQVRGEREREKERERGRKEDVKHSLFLYYLLFSIVSFI